MAVCAGMLADRLAVPVQPEPGEAVQYDRYGLIGGPRAIRVLDTQQHPAVIRPRIKPVEKRRARSADMEKAGG